MARRIYIPILSGFIMSLFLFGVFWTPSASAAATCANVRCASGSCIETPAGPTCTAKVTCASTLCQVGSRCEERASGPVCVPNHSNPNSHVTPIPYTYPTPHGYPNTHPKTRTRPRPYMEPRPAVRPRPYTRPSEHSSNCRTYRDSYRGYGYYRRDCAERPVYRPSRPHNSDHGYVRPRPPVMRPPNTRPPVTPPSEPRMCTREYRPVCAEVALQCVRAPCPAMKKTFSNTCEAGDNKILYNGVCR